MAKDSHGFDENVFYVPKEPPHILVMKKSDLKKILIGIFILIFIILISLIFLYSDILINFFTTNGIDIKI